ncbi:MAG: bifunctional oligoribonuclease/PAP phosphatase NrnA [Deltaproteobacteria bacterium]|jgi:phosphoesterase RecJ-like protein|nr:bifunctional oligoribonuclease/PAP phosphatase NrnA [Deltaproteobacteria bacterium]MBW2479345.1 bifunctional oligoribonuclease/PAP phosphatase NrnA [Deltaproteobacteria bacterium]
MDKIITHIKRAHHILLASHSEPDGDAVSSILALGLAIGQLGKKTTIYNASPIPAVYRFLPSVERIVRHIKKANTYDVALVLDCGDLPRVGEASATISRIPLVINIDHHISNTGFGDLQLIDPLACSTAEIVYRLIKAMDVSIDKAMATSVYTGILTDTGSFRFSSTNRAAFAISQEMTELGVEPHAVAQHVYGTYSLGRIKLLNLALDSIEISENGKLSIMTVTGAMFAETGTHPEDVDGMINYARRIEDVKVAALIHEQKNGKTYSNGQGHYHVSLRSDGSVDVAAIAGSFGGGGHTSAAGFQIETSLKKLKSDIITLAQNL